MSYFIGVDVGGTTCTIAIGNDRREVAHLSDQFPTLATEGAAATIGTIVQHAGAGMQKLGASLADVKTVGLSTPGPATLDGVLLKTPNLKGELWDKFPIRKALEEGIRQRESGSGAAVRYIGDGQAAALGEFTVRTGGVKWDGAAAHATKPQDLTSIFMVVVGTGLGGGEVRNGQVVRGSEGRAGHAGHILLPHYAYRYEHDRQLLVGNAYCTVESAVSLTALTHQLGYRLTLDEWKSHPLNAADGSMKDKAKQLRELAAQGDELALELFDDQARALGIGLLSVNYIGDYDLLVIGGGVCDLTAELRQRYRKTAEQAYLEHALDGFKNLDGIEFSVCGDAAPVIGALAQAYLTTEAAD